MASLQTYKTKRRFDHTPEPAVSRKAAKTKATLQFVVQRHDASHLHYDFRLEAGGVLKSWAVPKGPSLNPADKRLAVQVEDHPIAYGKFEGTIPEGNYGAGTVEIWDTGTYTPETPTATPEKEIEKQLRAGSIKFRLNGKKLNGSFALVRMKNGNNKNWLLIKHKDEFATTGKYDPDHTKAKTPAKAKTPKNRSTKRTATKTTPPPATSVRGGRAEKFKHFIKPMLTQLHDKPFDDDNWIFEMKWDGYRAIAETGPKGIRLYSRNGLSFANLYPTVADELTRIKKEAVLDGEIVALDKDNKPSFQKLQQYAGHTGLPLIYYVFDCLAYQGKDLTAMPLLERKKMLKKILPASDIIRYSDHIEASGTAFFNKVTEMNMEGIIAKRADSPYTTGRRTSDWLKIKNHNTQEAIIAGYTAPRGGRQHFGALLLGIQSGKTLKYIGHTGTGFTEKILRELHAKLKPLARTTSPFTGKIPVNATVTWVEPVLVCEVKFSEITDEGIMRHPVFLGLRIDKSAAETNHMDVAVKKTTTKRKAKKKKAAPQPETDAEDANNTTVTINHHRLTLTNLNKVYWPDDGFTKGDLIAYYASVRKYILPYLKNRPQSLKRNPNGIHDKGFFHKDAGGTAPAWVKSIALYSESADKDIDYIICNDAPTLTYLNNLGCIEINPWNSTTRHLDNPDYLIMDIDPSDKNTFDQVIETARVIKTVLDKAGAPGYCKTSGASGLHIYVPLHAAYTYAQIRPFAELIAILTEQQLPQITTTERTLTKRKGRIYIDYLQNKRGQTLASAYSVRPVPGASVSTPLAWKEVKPGLHPTDFTITNIQKRLDKKGDLFQEVLTGRINLGKCLKALEK